MRNKRGNPLSFPHNPDPGSRDFLFYFLLALLALLVLLGRMWYADTLFASGYRLARVNQYAQAQPLIRSAITLNAGEPLYHDEYSTTLAALTAIAVEQQQATLAAALAKQALTESDTAISISPKNVNFWKSRTKIFYSFSSFDPQFNPAAIQALQRAWELSPNDPKIIYNLAILYGRQNDNVKAIELFATIDCHETQLPRCLLCAQHFLPGNQRH